MEIQQILMQKNGMVISSLAREFMGSEIGDRIGTIKSLAEHFQVGNGTVQSALNRLEEVKALRFSKHGYKGTILAEINYALLAGLCGINGILGVMPIPFSLRYEGLATALYQTLNVGDIHVNLAFMSGAHNRIASLLEGRHDFVVVSGLSARHFRESYPQLEEAAELGDCSYVSSHVVIKRKGFSYPSYEGLKVGVDTSSYDQVKMTENFFKGRNIYTIPIRYSNVLRSLASKEIDLAIWSKDNINLSSDLVEIDTLIPHSGDSNETKASVLVTAPNKWVKKYIARHIPKGRMEEIQNAVIEGKHLSMY